MLFILLVALGAFLISGLTFFTGFGLGTLLLPFFLFVFSPAVAVAATAVVHLLNNLFKFALIGRHTSWRTVANFGLPAAAAAFAGAWLLGLLTLGEPLAAYAFLGREAVVTPVKLVIGGLILAFSLFDLVPALHDLRIDRRWLPAGGVLSGFFGGISGHQGAMRAAFLVKAGLAKEAFIATGIACAVLVDIARLSVYGATFFADPWEVVAGQGGLVLLATATGAAFLGAFLGRRLLHKATISGIRVLVGGLMSLTGVLVMTGIV